MTDIIYYDGNSPLSKKGKMMPYASGIHIEIEPEEGKPESINIRYGHIREISKTGGNSRIEFAATDGDSENRLIIFCDPGIHNIIYNYWTSGKQNPFERLQASFMGLANFKKILLGLVILPAVLFIILLILNKTYIFLPLSLDKKIGSMAAESFLSKAAVINNDNGKAIVENLTKKIIPENTSYTYTVHILKNPEINAFAFPNGHILIYSGLINHSRSPEELAGVLSHEISHVEKRHGIRQVIRLMGMSYLISSMVGAGIEGLDIAETISEVINIFIYNKYSREFEKEADLNSVRLLANAGIQPDGILEFLERMRGARNTPRFFNWISSHPVTDDRMRYLKKELDKVGFSRVKKRHLMSDAEWLALKDTVRLAK